jgi:hypothetical protein
MPLPRKLHQIWWQGVSAIPERYDVHRESVRKNLPADWSHRIWSGPEIVRLARATDPRTARLLERSDIPLI